MSNNSSGVFSANTQFRQTDYVRSIDTGVDLLAGSFLANGSSDPVNTQFRGNYFTVVHTGTGIWTVTIHLNIPRALVPVSTQSVGPGQPNGLLLEPRAWPVGDADTPTAPTITKCTCTRYLNSSLPGTFQIHGYSTGTTHSDGASTDRIFFQLGWKHTGFAP